MSTEHPLSRSCPYLDTIDRTVLDFDFEKLCSVSLTNNNVYACLVCGKYFQGLVYVCVTSPLELHLSMSFRAWSALTCLHPQCTGMYVCLVLIPLVSPLLYVHLYLWYLWYHYIPTTVVWFRLTLYTQVGHHVFLNLETLQFYCLPDNYQIIDPSLEDIKVPHTVSSTALILSLPFCLPPSLLCSMY